MPKLNLGKVLVATILIAVVYAALNSGVSHPVKAGGNTMHTKLEELWELTLRGNPVVVEVITAPTSQVDRVIPKGFIQGYVEVVGDDFACFTDKAPLGETVQCLRTDAILGLVGGGNLVNTTPQ